MLAVGAAAARGAAHDDLGRCGFRAVLARLAGDISHIKQAKVIATHPLSPRIMTLSRVRLREAIAQNPKTWLLHAVELQPLSLRTPFNARQRMTR
jgi:hypothetical protein